MTADPVRTYAVNQQTALTAAPQPQLQLHSDTGTQSVHQQYLRALPFDRLGDVGLQLVSLLGRPLGLQVVEQCFPAHDLSSRFDSFRYHSTCRPGAMTDSCVLSNAIKHHKTW